MLNLPYEYCQPRQINDRWRVASQRRSAPIDNVPMKQRCGLPLARRRLRGERQQADRCHLLSDESARR